MTKYLILFFLATSILFSCSGDDDEPIEEVNSPYAGIWSGTMEGDLKGSLTINVSTDGSFFSTSVTMRGSATWPGFVDDQGSLTGSTTGTDGTILSGTGTLTLGGSGGRGTYSTSGGPDPVVRGTWQVTRDD